jgi:hypothetical protein
MKIFLAFYEYVPENKFNLCDYLYQGFLNIFECTLCKYNAYYHVSLSYEENGETVHWSSDVKHGGVFTTNNHPYTNKDITMHRTMIIEDENFYKMVKLLKKLELSAYNSSTICQNLFGNFFTSFINLYYLGEFIPKKPDTWSCSSLICEALKEAGVKNLPNNSDYCTPQMIYNIIYENSILTMKGDIPYMNKYDF